MGQTLNRKFYYFFLLNPSLSSLSVNKEVKSKDKKVLLLSKYPCTNLFLDEFDANLDDLDKDLDRDLPDALDDELERDPFEEFDADPLDEFDLDLLLDLVLVLDRDLDLDLEVLDDGEDLD